MFVDARGQVRGVGVDVQAVGLQDWYWDRDWEAIVESVRVKARRAVRYTLIDC